MRNPWKLTTFALGAVLAATLGHSALVPDAAADAEPQPLMQSALRSLKNAKEHLSRATADKGGHRKAAIELTDKAIDQVQKGIAFDKKN